MHRLVFQGLPAAIPGWMLAPRDQFGTAAMKFVTLAFAASGALALAACNHEAAPAKEPVVQKDTPSPAPTTPAAANPDDARFARALEYDCGAGGKLQVSLGYGNDRNAVARLNGGAVKTLPADTTVQDSMTFAASGTKLVMGFDANATYMDGATKLTCKFVTRALPAPTAAGVTQTITASDAGKTVAFKKGEKIAVALVGVPTAGYVWASDSAPGFVTVSDGPGGPTSSAQMLPGFAGGNHWEVLIIEATGPGEGELVLAQRRPWEKKADKDATTFKVKLKVG
jgi:predicted secreted protein